MESLSQEILELIVYHLSLFDDSEDTRLPWEPPVRNIHPYATLSRPWQYAVERFTMAQITTSSADLDIFCQVLASPRRRKLLRRLRYEITLPAYSENRKFCLETKRETRVNQQVFNQGIIDLYHELATWQTQGMSVEIAASSPTDQTPYGLGWTRWHHKGIYLSLDNVNLPVLSSVNELEIPNARREIHPATIALAKALESPSLRNLKSLSIYIEQGIPHNHSFINSSLDPKYPHGDVLNVAIRKLADRARLTTLSLTGDWLISPALFDEATFPYLERVKVEGALITYDGRWYYTGDPSAEESESPPSAAYADDDNSSSDSNSSFNSEINEDINEDREELLNGDSPYHMWRTQPDPEMFGALMKSAAAAALRMPSLRNLMISVGQVPMNDNTIIAECLAPGEKGEWVQGPTREELGVRRWHVTLMPNAKWDAPGDIQALWDEYVGKEGIAAVSHFSYELEGNTDMQ
ncbi:hypothetical protein MW887_005720 [Aspergillus wentii]|nr:hypothetical protein MW887_005720 [Aspergillus wentii]